MISIEVTEELREQANEHGYGLSEDYDRSPKERDFDGYVGDLGELAFKRILEEKTSFDYEYLGGIDEADFVVDGHTVDIKTRTVIDDDKRDLIVPTDLDGGFHDFYLLLRCVYAEDDYETFDRHERTIEALEFIGLWDSATVERVSQPFCPPSARGRMSKNYRETVICDYGTHADLMDFASLMDSQEQAQQAQSAD